MFPLLAVAASAPALAQTSTDPAYLAYLDALEDVTEIAPYPLTPRRLFEGMVSIVAPYTGAVVGRTFVYGDDQLPGTLQEIHFLKQPLDPGANYRFVHDGLIDPNEVEVLEDLDANWEGLPCYAHTAALTGAPNAALNAELDYAPNIDRYFFRVKQGGVVVGFMLREHHHVPNEPVRFFEHWALLPGFEQPGGEGDAMTLVQGEAVATTTAYWNKLAQIHALLPENWQGFAQYQFSEGSNCLSVLD